MNCSDGHTAVSFPSFTLFSDCLPGELQLELAWKPRVEILGAHTTTPLKRILTLAKYARLAQHLGKDWGN